MQYDISYDIDFSSLFEFINQVQKDDSYKSKTVSAIREAGDYLAQTWIDVAQKKFRHSQGGYAQGIVEGVRYPFQNDPLRYRIEHTKDYALYLERGFASFDLKKMLMTSVKVRVSKEGKRYLIIPFRHGVPGSKGLREMPKDVYKQAKELRQSVVLGFHKEGIQRGARTFREAQMLKKYNSKKVERRLYSWGEKLQGFEGTKYEGMYRFEKNPNKVRPLDLGKFINKGDNQIQYSNYITFRAMVEDSNGWIHPGLKPMNILGEAVEIAESRIIDIIAEGVMDDMKYLGFE